MMRLLHAGSLIAACAVLAAAPAKAQLPQEDSAVFDTKCDRACLIGILGKFMAAVRANSPSAVPAAPKVRFTENNVVVPLGKGGVWGRIDHVDAVGMEVADTQTRNAAWFGSVRENGAPAIFAVRIHVDAEGRIDEIESVVHRKTALPAPFGDVTKMVHDPAFNEVLPPKERRSRARLLAIADSYFDTVEVNDGQVLAPFSEDCGRLENGISTTSGTGLASAIAQGCEAQFKLGMYHINKRIRERRYPIVDEERGVVVATGFFDHDNELNRYLLTNGREMKTALNWPNSISLLEAFRIKDAQIQRIEAVFTYVPYSMHNPWAGPLKPAPVAVPDAKACDDACLTRLSGRVMAAYANRGWNSLPWAKRVANSENSVGLQVGEGIWLTTDKVDQKPLIVADAQTGKAVWIGRIEEHGQPAWGAVTVSADGDRIGAVDALIRRKEYGPPYVEPVAGPNFSTLSPAMRTERSAMLAAIDRFYAAINAHDGVAPAALAANCQWAVNGQAVSACPVPFTGRLLQGLERVRDHKVLAVDETRGLVAVSTYEDFPATKAQFADASGKTFKDSLPFPRTLQVVELFRFERGKISRVEAYTSELPYGMKAR